MDPDHRKPPNRCVVGTSPATVVVHKRTAEKGILWALLLVEAASGAQTTRKHIDWYIGHDWNWLSEPDHPARMAALEFALKTHQDLVDGVFPSFLHLNCTSGAASLVPDVNFSGYAPFIGAGIEVSATFEGDSGCCPYGQSSCPMYEHRDALAEGLLSLAVRYNLSGYTQDWEFTDSFNHTGFNSTMAHVASVLRDHGLGLGNSISSSCEQKNALNGAPFCSPAYRNEPWASVLTDMGTYSPVTGCGCHGCPYDPQFNSNCSASEFGGSLAWELNGTRGSCRADPGNDATVLRYCGFEGQVMNLLHGDSMTAYPDRWPQLSPGLWLGDCAPGSNASSLTGHGWDQSSLAAFLQFLDSVGVTRIAVWCGAQMPCPTVAEHCPWMYSILRDWKHRSTHLDPKYEM
jgi:hypothetical protein